MRRGRILILLGLILAIGTAAAVFVLLQGASDQPATEVKREEVVVASQPIAEDELVDGRLELRAVPVELIPEAALRSLDGTTGMLAAGPIPQGTVIQPELLVSPEQLAREGELGKVIEPGYQAVALPIDELSAVSYGIQAGDNIDILMTFAFIDVDMETQIIEPLCPPDCGTAGEGESIEAISTLQRPRRVAQLTLQDVEVLGVGRWNFVPPPTEQQQAAVEE
jgi:Flp pilus assembly protein CpaB